MLIYKHTNIYKGLATIECEDFSRQREISRYFTGESGFIYTDNLQELITFPTFYNYPQVTLKPKDKIFFSDSYIPATLMSRLKDTGMPLKRTINVQQASYIIMDDPRVRSFDSWFIPSNRLPFILLHNEDNDAAGIIALGYRDQKDMQKLQQLYKNVAKEFSDSKFKVYYSICVRNLDQAIFLRDYNQKIVRSEDVIKFMQTYTSKPTIEEWDGIEAILRSQDQEQRKLGWNLLQNYNLEDHYMELLCLIKKLNTTKTSYGYYSSGYFTGSLSKACEYVLKQLHINIDSLRTMTDHNSCLSVYLKSLSNPLASSVTKGKLLGILKTTAIAKILEKNCVEFSYLGTTNLSIIPNTGEPILDNSNDVENNLVQKIKTDISMEGDYIFVHQLLNDFNLQLKIKRDDKE